MIHSMLVGFLLDGRHSGIDKYLLGFCDAARDAGTKLDFLTQEIDPALREHLASYGFGLLEVPSLKRPLTQRRAIRRILKNGGYDAVYLNLSESFNCALLSAAKSRKIPVRVVHSHSSGVDRMSALSRRIRRVLHKLFRPYLTRNATRRLACSSAAGTWMFKGSFEIIRNAVDAARFSFEPDERERVRREMKLGSRPVYLHVGNFDYAKNQNYLLDVMSEVAARESDACLLLAGDGETLNALREMAAAVGVSERVHFHGVRTDVPALLSAADVFLFPSRFEGFPITVLEAQFSGIPCVLSDAIPKEAKIGENVVYLKTDDPAAWADAALSFKGERGKAALLPGSEQYDAEHNKQQLLSILKNGEVQ